MSVNTKVNGELVKSAGLYSVRKPIGMADIYSTEERQVGLWIDNKPLYQKTINCGTLPNNTTKTVAHGISNIDTIVNTYGHAKATANQTPIPFVNNTSVGSQVALFADATNITLRTSEDKTPYTGYVTILYTKTTDTPWSGKFVPQGYGYVSSGDIYSFEERQVGVWTDGKPLYQKSIKLDDVTVPQSGRVLIGLGTYISNIDNVIGGEVIVIDGGTNLVLPSFQIATMSQYGLTYTINKADGIVISRGSDSGAVTRDFIATVRYTKTTDVAGSGEYVPSGDKAVHYSENEEVIGTWINGETLYRQVIHFSTSISVALDSAWHSTGVTLSNIDEITKLTCLGGSGGFVWNILSGFMNSGVLTLTSIANCGSGAVAGIADIILEYTKTS